MNIVLLEPLAVKNYIIEGLAKKAVDMGHTFKAYDNVTKDVEELKRRSREADILIIANNPLPGEVIRAAERLKYIAVAFTGVDHVDKAACMEKGIKVSNAAGYSTDSVAELAVALIIDALRNVIPCDERVRRGGTKEGLVGTQLKGKTVGIVGTGAIGLRVGELLRPFKCKLLGYSRSERMEGKNLGIEYVSLEELLKSSDIVTLHVPLNEDTKKLINEERLKLMKPSSVLVNLARGPVVDSNALADALNQGKIAKACIDVFETEPPIEENHPLLKAKNTLVTPHIAFATEESMIIRAELTFDNLYSYLEGSIKNQVI